VHLPECRAFLFYTYLKGVPTMANLILKNGSFYRDGEKVPLEFGNKEQIKMLKKIKELSGDGVLAKVDEDELISLEYVCLCGTPFRKQYTYDQWNEFQHDKFICAGCDLKYFLDGEVFNPFVVVKLDKKKASRKEVSNG